MRECSAPSAGDPMRRCGAWAPGSASSAATVGAFLKATLTQ